MWYNLYNYFEYSYHKEVDDGIVEDIIVVMRSLSLLTEFSPQLTFVDEVPPVQGGRQPLPGLLYIDDMGAKYKVEVKYLKAFFTVITRKMVLTLNLD